MGNTWTKNTRPESSDDVMLVDMPDLPMLDGVDDIPQCSKTEKTISVSKIDLLNDGSRWNGNCHREKQCTTCGDWIDLGKADTGEAALIDHEGKRRCLAKLERNKEIQESAASEEALDDLRGSGTVSPHTCRSRGVALYSPLSSVSFVSGTISST
jgi:ferredoxin